MRHYRLGAHTKTDLKLHVIWIPKYRRPVLTGEVAVRVREIIRTITAQHELEIISGKVARDHVHVLISYRPTGYLAVATGTVTDEVIREYIDDEAGEQIADDSRFPIDS